jgi:rRNA processing protein Gar1
MSVLGKVGIALASVVGAVGLVYGVVKLDEQLKSKKNIDQLKDATSGVKSFPLFHDPVVP